MLATGDSSSFQHLVFRQINAEESASKLLSLCNMSDATYGNGNGLDQQVSSPHPHPHHPHRPRHPRHPLMLVSYTPHNI